MQTENVMLIQINTDRNITGDEVTAARIRAVVNQVLTHHAERITRVEVFLSDQNSKEKDGANDMRCVLEARLEGRAPIAVSMDADTVPLAVDGAAEKLLRLIESTLGREQAMTVVDAQR
jgi:hypothetical protein